MILKGRLIVSVFALIASFSIFVAFAFAEGEQKGEINTTKVNVRTGPSLRDGIVTTLNTGNRVLVLDNSTDWYKINFDGKEGYVFKDFIHLTDKVNITAQVNQVGVITASDVRLRKTPSKSGAIVTTLWSGLKVELMYKNGEWYNVKTPRGRIGFVHHTLLRPTDETVSRSSDIVRPVDSETGQGIVEYAKRFIGTGYVYGGTSPNGFDCSGFVQYVMRNKTGITLHRVAASMASNGTRVSNDDKLPGDIMLYSSPGSGGYIDHVGIYVGDGQIIHASRTAKKVKISSINTPYFSNHLQSIRRIR